jgi:hypothetical protein
MAERELAQEFFKHRVLSAKLPAGYGWEENLQRMWADGYSRSEAWRGHLVYSVTKEELRLPEDFSERQARGAVIRTRADVLLLNAYAADMLSILESSRRWLIGGVCCLIAIVTIL